MTIDEFKEKIAPYMKKGWVAMCPSDDWRFYNTKPKIVLEYWHNIWSGSDSYSSSLDMFNIEPVDNWKESLIEVGNA